MLLEQTSGLSIGTQVTTQFTPHMGGISSTLAPDSSFLLMWTLRGSGEESGGRVLATHRGNLDSTPSCSSQPLQAFGE